MSVEVAIGQRETEREIQARRRVMKPSEVDLHHVPNWFRRRLLKAYGCSDRDTAGWAVLCHARDANDWTWLDHHGSTKWDGQPAFVSEPYGVTAKELQQVADMCERCGLFYRVSANSYWYPGSTIRILIFEPEN